VPMTRERFEYLHTHHDAKLTPEEIAEGYFFCCTWDGMLIHKSDREAECCSCNNYRHETIQKRDELLAGGGMNKGEAK